MRVAAIVAGLMLFTALVAIPFAPDPAPRAPASIARGAPCRDATTPAPAIIGR